MMVVAVLFLAAREYGVWNGGCGVGDDGEYDCTP